MKKLHKAINVLSTARSVKPCVAMCASLSLAAAIGVNAADHREAPNASAQLSVDIGDYYAWHNDDDQINLVLTFGTFAAAGTPATYDSNALYAFHFDTSAQVDGVSDATVFARFAQNVLGEWGLQVTMPDGSTISTPVESVESDGQTSIWAGLADDPFFFDQEGFRATLDTGTLAFDPTRDSVAGLNITAIVLQLPIEEISPNGSTFQTWSTTSSL